MKEDISRHWRPNPITSKSLLSSGYSQKQINNIGKAFIKRHFNKTIEDASSKFNKMVRDSGNGHDIKPTNDNAVNDIKNIKSHKSKHGEKRAQEAQSDNTVMTQEEARQWFMSNRN